MCIYALRRSRCSSDGPPHAQLAPPPRPPPQGTAHHCQCSQSCSPPPLHCLRHPTPPQHTHLDALGLWRQHHPPRRSGPHGAAAELAMGGVEGVKQSFVSVRHITQISARGSVSFARFQGSVGGAAHVETSDGDLQPLPQPAAAAAAMSSANESGLVPALLPAPLPTNSCPPSLHQHHQDGMAAQAGRQGEELEAALVPAREHAPRVPQRPRRRPGESFMHCRLVVRVPSAPAGGTCPPTLAAGAVARTAAHHHAAPPLPHRPPPMRRS